MTLEVCLYGAHAFGLGPLVAVLWRLKRPVGKQLVEDTGVGELVGGLSQVVPRMSRSVVHAR